MTTRNVDLVVSAAVAMTISPASLAAGAGRQSAMVTNSDNNPAALIHVILTGGTAPAAGEVYSVFLLRGDGVQRTDGAGSGDAGMLVNNAPLLGTMAVSAAGNSSSFGEFDTEPLGPLGNEWGVAVRNDSGQALNATAGNHRVTYVYYKPQIDDEV